MVNFLKGKKTYLLAILAVLNILGFQSGMIPEDVANTILTLLIPGIAVTLKAGQSRIEERL